MDSESGGSEVPVSGNGGKTENTKKNPLPMIFMILAICVVGLIIGIICLKVLKDKNADTISFCGKIDLIDYHDFANEVRENVDVATDYGLEQAKADFECQLSLGEYDGVRIRLAYEYASFLRDYEDPEVGAEFLVGFFEGYMDKTDNQDDLAGYNVDSALWLYEYMLNSGINLKDKILKNAYRAEDLSPTWQSAMSIYLIESYLGNDEEASEYYDLSLERGYTASSDTELLEREGVENGG